MPWRIGDDGLKRSMVDGEERIVVCEPNEAEKRIMMVVRMLETQRHEQVLEGIFAGYFIAKYLRDVSDL